MSINLLNNKLEDTNPQSKESLLPKKNNVKTPELKEETPVISSSFKSNGGNGKKNGNLKNGNNEKEGNNLKKDKNLPIDKIKDIKKRKKKGRHKEESQVLEINLVKETVGVPLEWKRLLSILFIFMSFSLFIVFEAYFYLSWFGGQEEAASSYSEQRVIDINQELNEVRLEAADAIAFKERLNLINYMFEKHVYWTNFFSLLESNTINGIHFTEFTGDTSGYYIIPSRADDFMAIGTQIRTMARDENVLSASVVNGTLGELVDDVKEGEEPEKPGVFFDLNMSVNPNIFFN